MVLLAGLAVIAGSALWLILTGNIGVRYSSDHDDTVPMWFRWIPAFVGILLVWLVPSGVRPLPYPATTSVQRARNIEAVALLAAAVLFTVALRLAGGGEPAHTLLKLPLLLLVPATVFWLLRRDTAGRAPGQVRDAQRPLYRAGPAVPVVAWFVLSYATPLATPPSSYASTVDLLTLVGTVVVVFLLNSLLEEVFYRRWLQTRWEPILGRWPAVLLASLLWASWHIGIHSTGRLDVDLASVVVNQGVLGLFLGYLWSKYRLMWPILLVHGAINAAPIAISLLG